MRIHIENLTIDTIIGILEQERVASQKLIANIKIDYKQKNKKDFINYAQIITTIEEDIKKQQYKLLEDALRGLEYTIKKSYPRIEKLKIKLTKPDIISNCQVGISKKWKF
jgi:dihydroneopterin aldolase